MSDPRRCPFCNAETGNGSHTGCAGLFRDVMSAGGDVPPEVDEAARRGAERLRHYTLVRLLGRGGMGEVWKAWDGVLARWVAIKVVPKEDADDAARFQRESRMAARLRHPHIAAVYEVGEDQGRAFIAMDYIEGDTLAAAELPADRVAPVFASVTRAVEAAHRAGVIHRDLKPQNILISKELWPFVTDFGLARSLSPGGTVSATGTVLGTPAYMSPEQAAGRLEDVDERSDVYSLGATFYHVLCGHAPFSGEPLAILGAVVHQEPRRPRSVRPAIPAPLETIVLKAMSKSKQERYASAAELADDLDRFVAHESIQGKVPGRFRRFLRRARGPAAGVAILAAGIIGAVWLDRRRVPAATVAPAPLLKPGPEEREPRLDRFVRALAALPSRAEFLRRNAAGLSPDFDLPEERSPALDWARACRAVLDRLRTGAATERDLALVALQAAALNPQLFASAEETAFRLLEERLDGLTRDLADAPRALRRERQAAVDAALKDWSDFTSQVTPALKALHPSLSGQARFLEALPDRFPIDHAVLDGVDLLACLRAPNPEAELALAERTLKIREALPRPSLETRRSLYTAIVVASVHGSLLDGRTEEEAAERVKEYGPKLAAAGGPDELGVYSPRVRRAVDALLRK